MPKTTVIHTVSGPGGALEAILVKIVKFSEIHNISINIRKLIKNKTDEFIILIDKLLYIEYQFVFDLFWVRFDFDTHDSHGVFCNVNLRQTTIQNNVNGNFS